MQLAVSVTGMTMGIGSGDGTEQSASVLILSLSQHRSQPVLQGQDSSQFSVFPTI